MKRWRGGSLTLCCAQQKHLNRCSGEWFLKRELNACLDILESTMSGIAMSRVSYVVSLFFSMSFPSTSDGFRK